MKKWIVVLVVGLVSMSMSFAANKPKLKQEIQEKVRIDLSDIYLDEFNQDYVIVSFQIINDEIKIQEINGTSAELKERIIEELCEIKVDAEYEEGETYFFKFTFKKI
ncbi:MAG: hypothetical protein QNK23_09295 [Crocinitomicaceae bacterium]|nr:hypothetical protein [Crocinitomicaceae bacterium]